MRKYQQSKILEMLLTLQEANNKLKKQLPSDYSCKPACGLPGHCSKNQGIHREYRGYGHANCHHVGGVIEHEYLFAETKSRYV